MRKYRFITRLISLILLISVMATSFSACKDNNKENLNLEELTNPGFPIDKWEYDAPEKHNINIAALKELEKKMSDDALSGKSYGVSTIITRDGYIVYKNTEGSLNYTDLFELWSLTTSFVSALVGIAIEEGYIGDVDDKVLDYFKDYEIENIDEMKESMTIKDVLMMRSGLTWEDNRAENYVSFEIKNNENPVLSLLSAPMESQPGSVWENNIASPSILTAVIQKTTDMTVLEYAKEKLFEPLGIKEVVWESDKQGINFGGFGLRMMPHDILKLGYLFLNNGEWDGKQIIPAAWIKESVSSEYSWKSVESIEAGKHILDTDDFEVIMKESVGAGEIYMAMGYGGQYIYVLPKYNIVAAVTNLFNDEPYRNQEISAEEYGDTVILPNVLASVSDAAEYTKKENIKSELSNSSSVPDATGELLIYKYTYYDELIDAAVKLYQNEYPDVEVKVIEFGDEYYDTLKTEVAAGKGPDLWIGNHYDFDDIYKTADTGVFEDLTEYMKSDGTDWSLYNKTVIESGIYKGKQYFLPMGYQVNILMTTEEIMQEEEIDFSSLKTFSDLMKAIGKIQQKYSPQEKCLFRYSESSQWEDSLLSNYLPWNGMPFINYETGEIIKDSDTLRDTADALKWAYTDEPRGLVYHPTSAGDLIADRRLFLPLTYGDVIEFFYENYGFLAYYCKPLYLPFPDVDGNVTASVNLMGAVLKNSNNKLNAYNFLKILLSERIQSSELIGIQYSICVPVLKNAIKTRFDKILKRQTEVFKDAPWQHFNEKGYIDEWSNPMPKEEAERFSNMLINIDRCVIQSTEPQGLFNKEFKPYLEGSKTYEQCFAAFRNSLELYYSE